LKKKKLVDLHSCMEKWVYEFVTLARKKEFFSDFLASPCQITAILIGEERFLIILVRHDMKRADLEILSLSAESSGEEAWDIIDSRVLVDPYFLEKGYAIEIAGMLGKILRRHPSVPEEPHITGFGYFKDHKIEEGYLLISGVDIRKDTPKNLPSLRARRGASIRTPHKAAETAREVEFIASMWFPPIAFEDGPITLRKTSVFQTEYKGHKVLFDNKSFISVLVPIKPPLGPFVDKAVDLMNEIIATANILDVAGIAVAAEDIVTFTHKEDAQHPSAVGHWKKPTVRSLLFEDFLGAPSRIYEFDSFVSFRIINTSLMESIIRKAEKITGNREMKNYLSLFLDATTHVIAGASKAAFLHGWIVIEKYVDDLWSKEIVQQGIAGRRRKKLESILWTTDYKLEVLNLMGAIPNERYVEIIRLKRIRNGIVHEERKVHSREAQECLKLCKSIVLELVRSKCFVEV